MRTDLLPSILLQVVAPVVLIAGAGWLYGWRSKVDPRPIAGLAFRVLTPCLVFTTLSGLEWGGSSVRLMALFALLSMALQAVLAWLVGHLLHLEAPVSNAFLLVSVISNCGNLGLPLSLFAFGQEGLDLALVYTMISLLLLSSVGVYVASRGRSGSWESLLSVVKAPVVWVAVLAMLVNLSGRDVPEFVGNPIELVGSGALPVMLLILGIQLSRLSLAESKRAIAAATFLRLAAAPVLAVALAAFLGMQGVARQVGILQASMPAAVMATILAAEFDAAPRFAAGTVLTSTLLSLVSLTALLVWLW